jgi:hypothetical protein
MTNLKIIVPLLVLALQVIMKFVVGRRIERKNYLELICELPTNIIFLSISFSLVYIFLHESIKQESVITFMLFVILSLIVVTIFRECKLLSDATRTKSKTALLVFLIILNYPISLACLYFASEKLLYEKPIVKQEQTQELKQTDKCK